MLALKNGFLMDLRCWIVNTYMNTYLDHMSLTIVGKFSKIFFISLFFVSICQIDF